MPDFTRRTHIVRCPVDKDNPDGVYVDVEVLDALAFRGTMGEELILRFHPDNIDPCIIDDVGSGNEKDPGGDAATRRSHMEHITNKDGGDMFIEVLDTIAFRTENGKEWILNLPSKNSSQFSTNDESDVGDSTRRTHAEKVSASFEAKPDNYIKVIRADQVAFRTIMGEEMIIKMPSSDDPNSHDPRASTSVTPEGYDPQDENSPKPPINPDKNVYVAFPKDGSGSPFTNAEKVAQGMLWWIRKVSGGEILVVQIDISKKNYSNSNSDNLPGQGGTLSDIELDGNFGFKISSVDDDFNKDKSKDAPDAVKIMPTKPPSDPPDPNATPKINLKDDVLWWTDQPNKDKADDWTVLLFLNVAEIAKKDSGKKVKLTLKLPKLGRAGGDINAVGNYIWAVSGGDQFTYVPIHPAPNAANAFLPYPFRDQGDTGVGDGGGSYLSTYIGLWNNDPSRDEASYFRNHPGEKDRLANLHVQLPTHFPGENGAFGFFTAQGAGDWAAFNNALGIADYNLAQQNNTSNIVFPPPTVFEALSIDFTQAAGPSPELKVTVTASLFGGKQTFDYDTKNIPLFELPTNKDKKVIGQFGHVAKFDGSTITVLFDTKPDPQSGKRKLTVTEVLAPPTTTP